jgi:aspartyl-tRNA(Asn)/glutamyl-tRNA(Gln) amidotransferase subunit B
VALEVCDGKMEEGSMRCEANMSIRPVGTHALGMKTELKNLNSFSSVFRGIEYEFERQVAVVQAGGAIIQETRRWDDAREMTAPMRSKEMEEEYRYFPEPDLVPLQLDPEWIENVRRGLPELPEQRRRRYVKTLGLPSVDAAVLVANPDLSHFFDAAVRLRSADPKTVANWLMGDFSRVLNEAGMSARDSRLTPENLVTLIRLVESGDISNRIARDIFEETHRTGKGPDEIVRDRGLTQVSDENAIEAIADQVIADNAEIVAKFHAGKESVLGFLVGQLMKASQGRANPQMAQRILRSRLAAGA